MNPTLEDIVAAYRSGIRLPCCGWQGGCGGCFDTREHDIERLGITVEMPIKDAIRLATHSVHLDTGTMHPHQRRLGRSNVKNATPLLLGVAKQLASAMTFHEVLSTVSQVLSPIRGFGDVAIYDFSDRISFALGLSPSRVYLHAGVTVGAKALGINVSNKKFLEPSELPKALRVLSAAELEDLLCIYKNCF